MRTFTASHCPVPPREDPAYAPAAGRFRWTGLIFAAAALILGLLPGAATFALNPNAASDIGLDAVPVPAWLFVAVWLVIYPSMGVAGWHVWQRLHQVDACVPLAVLIAGFLQTTAFWLTDSLRTTAVLDATGFLLAATTVWVASRFSRQAVPWLLPWLVWMPITLGIKLAVLIGSG